MYSTHAFRFHFYGLTLVKTREFFFSNSVNRCTGNYFSNRTIVIARQKFSLHGVSLRMWHRLKLSGERNSRKNVYCHIFSFNLKYSLLSGRFFYVRSLANQLVCLSFINLFCMSFIFLRTRNILATKAFSFMAKPALASYLLQMVAILNFKNQVYTSQYRLPLA